MYATSKKILQIYSFSIVQNESRIRKIPPEYKEQFQNMDPDCYYPESISGKGFRKSSPEFDPKKVSMYSVLWNVLMNIHTKFPN